jgi:alkylresorcinol/alkylpyrone synthase
LSKIVSIGTAVPPYELQQTEAKSFAQQIFGDLEEHLLAVFDHAAIDRRFISCPVEWYWETHTFAERNALYIQMASTLAAEAVQHCLQQANVRADQIDHLIFVSTTGIATPSIDAYLINQLGFSPHIRRTPIWGLGCAGGVAGLSRAYEYTKGFPTARVLLVTVELCSLTFCPQDHEKSNIVATSLFGDGAAAVLVVGDEIEAAHAPVIVDSLSTLWLDSLEVMGWDVVEDGLKVVFSKDIPIIVHQQVKPLVDRFLAHCHVSLEDIVSMISHPGGKKVLAAYEQALALSNEKFRFSYDILRQYGNMSSATVLFVLQQVMETKPKTGFGLMTTLGPGFSSELLLLRWGESR